MEGRELSTDKGTVNGSCTGGFGGIKHATKMCQGGWIFTVQIGSYAQKSTGEVSPGAQLASRTGVPKEEQPSWTGTGKVLIHKGKLLGYTNTQGDPRLMGAVLNLWLNAATTVWRFLLLFLLKLWYLLLLFSC